MKVNKKIYKLIIIIFLLFLSINVRASNVSKTNEETDYELVIEDDANLLKSDEISKLEKVMMPLTKYGNVIFKTIEKNNTTANIYASNYYHEKFQSNSGTMFLIDMDNRKIYIFSDGNNYKIITNAKANIITDNIYRYASYEDYYTCAKNAFDQVYTLLEGGKISEPMRYISNALISIVVAFLFNFIIVLSATKVKRASNPEVMNNCNIDFKVDNIVGKKTGVERVYSPVESSSGGSAGGGSSGGGSSGGGGGHSF